MMPRIAYVNGRYVRHTDAAVHIDDRGYQFADAVYEVLLAIEGGLWDLDAHFDRLDRSLGELEIEAPMSRGALTTVLISLLRRNRLDNALIYLQVTRGVAPRSHAFPATPVEPSIVITAKPFDLQKLDAQAEAGVSVITQPDIRWGRVDIKTTGLLPNALAKEAARRAGALEALLLRDGKVTEGAASNAWMVTAKGEIVTHPLGHEILGGITRQTIIACARELQIKVIERAFTLKEANEAAEFFITSAGNLVMPVIRIDDQEIGDGSPGAVTRRLRDAYIRKCGATAVWREERSCVMA
jgi:D-alanine transaminase